MTPMGPIPLLLSILVGLVLGLVTWGVLRLRRQRDESQSTSPDGVLLALFALAAFALGAFLTYALLGLGG
jgi:NhaP-type Na+/H+ or K+/H+ antiporter